MNKVMVIDNDYGVVFGKFGNNDVFIESVVYGNKDDVINEFLDISEKCYYNDNEMMNEINININKLKDINDNGKWFLGNDDEGMLCVGVEL
jgi:hypothetical protein